MCKHEKALWQEFLGEFLWFVIFVVLSTIFWVFGVSVPVGKAMV